jgi:hypothetical protein
MMRQFNMMNMQQNQGPNPFAQMMQNRTVD